MQGRISSFRRGVHHTYSNQMIVIAEGIDKKEAAEKLVGKKVVYNTGKRDILGEVRSAHGNHGALRVLFESGMPGQALGAEVKID
ncbi:50S ribosomal protein L35ae [Nanoarchaeota archaeon]